MLSMDSQRDPQTGTRVIHTDLRGKELLSSSQLNKGTAFTDEERHALHLLGKLPVRIETLEDQVERVYEQYQSFQTNLSKNVFLNALHDNNQVLFYRLVQTHLCEMLPTIYTPIVGTAVKKFSHEFRRTRGLYISYTDMDHMEEMLDNRTNPNIDIIVVTDGEGVLGIGDQGIGGMDIPIAKLMVYTLCAGIDHLRTLPICLDVGTNNEELLNDPMYLGLRQKRITGDQYHAFIERFIKAVKKKFTWVFLHWEDFGRENASHNLRTYQQALCSFNDDIQGTGVITLAAILSAVKANGSTLADQRIVVFGAGSAGTGITNHIREAMVQAGMSDEEAKKKFWLIDRQGLLTTESEGLTQDQSHYARDPNECQDWSKAPNGEMDLATVIKRVQPTILLGCSAVTGAFSQSIVKCMQANTQRPIICPLSNPTERAEATPTDLIEWTQGQALVATGSPFDPVAFDNREITIAQCNNALAFPGIGLGVLATQAKSVSQGMLWAASQTIAEQAPINHDPEGPLLPQIKDANALAIQVAVAVAEAARREKLDTVNQDKDLHTVIQSLVWRPEYPSIKPKN